jgi:hypothetical protein
MKSLSGSVSLPLLCALALGAVAPAHAQGGQIAFSGAVLAPTCATAGVARAEKSGTDAAAMVCDRTGTDPGRTYARQVVSLDAAHVANDPLLGYFAGYVKAEGLDAGQPKLVVRTYD